MTILERDVAEGRFHHDLYEQLNAFPIRAPSLRERPDDIPILVDYFVSRIAPVVLRNNGEDIAVRLLRSDDIQPWHALITPPDAVSRRRRLYGEVALHSRPRIGTLGNLPTPGMLKEDTHRGLPPGSIRRIREYIDSHLGENIRIETLATMAHLSVFHFARAFKQSVGMPPHEFMLRQRIKRAGQMLHSTELPLSEIALAVGFSDQSHESHKDAVCGNVDCQKSGMLTTGRI